MVTFDCATSHHDGVTLVTVRLRDIAAPTRVTVRNCLDGPVWPPRSEGLPEDGWTATGFSGVLAPGSHALGYATPARPEAPPAELADVEAVPGADAAAQGSTTPADVVRELGDPSPPSDAVPAAAADPSSPSPETTASADATGPPPTADSERPPTPKPPAGAEADGAPTDGDSDSAEPATAGDNAAQLPPELGPWLAEMERRTDTAEALAVAETVPEATRAVREAGGLEGVRALADAEDERRLRLLARRASRLADRRAAASIPVETLATLA